MTSSCEMFPSGKLGEGHTGFPTAASGSVIPSKLTSMKTRAIAQKIIVVSLLPASLPSLREKEEYCLKKKRRNIAYTILESRRQRTLPLPYPHGLLVSPSHMALDRSPHGPTGQHSHGASLPMKPWFPPGLCLSGSAAL